MMKLQFIRNLKLVLLCLGILSVTEIINYVVNSINYDFYNTYDNFNYTNCSIIKNITNSSDYLNILTICNCGDQLNSMYDFDKLNLILYVVSVIVLLIVIYDTINKINKNIKSKLTLNHIYFMFSIIYLIPIFIFGTYILFNLLYYENNYNPFCYNLILEQIKSDLLRFLITYSIISAILGFIIIEICCKKINSFNLNNRNLSINNNNTNNNQINSNNNQLNSDTLYDVTNVNNDDSTESDVLIRKRPHFVKFSEVVPPYSEN